MSEPTNDPSAAESRTTLAPVASCPTPDEMNAEDKTALEDVRSGATILFSDCFNDALRSEQEYAYKIGYERGVKDTTESANMACDLFAAGQKLAEEAGYARGLKDAAAAAGKDQNAEGSGS